MSGLIVDKPSGPTSHDVVDAVRALTGERRVGHTGTLDPLASGVLVVLIGSTTRLAEYLSGHDKGYRAVVRLGLETSTYDALGEVVEERRVDVTRARLEEALAEFRGRILQTPPAYSARRVAGKRAYERARAGEAVRLEPREVTIHALDLIAFDPPAVTLDLTCSAGTYVRSLAHDLGARLGCGGSLSELRRTKAGSFSLTESIPLAALQAEPARWHEAALPPAEMVRDLPALRVDAAGADQLRHGRALARDAARTAPPGPHRILDADERLLGIALPQPAAGVFVPHKILDA